MILKTLTLKNYRRFKDTLIEFPDGVTGVIGLNGVGKSTIFEAVAWALYGSPASRTPVDQIKRTGASPREPCRVELEFIFEGNAYKVIREMTGKTLSPSAVAYMNSKAMAKGAGAVTSFIQKTLGMDFKSFSTSVFAKQKELNALSSMNASERRPLILRMLGIDTLDDVIKEINTDRRTKTFLVEKLEVSLIDPSTGKAKKEVLTKKIDELEKKRVEVSREITILKENIEVLRKKVEEQSYNVEVEKQAYENMNQLYQRLVEEKTRYDRYQELKKTSSILEEKIIDRTKQIQTLEEKLGRYRGTSRMLEETNNRIKDLEEKILSSLRSIEQKKTLIKQIDEGIKELSEKKKNIEELGPDATCPTCERTLDEQYHILVKKYMDKLEEKSLEKTKLLQEIKSEEERHLILRKEKMALEKKKDYLQQQQREQERIHSNILHLNKELSREKKEYEDKQRVIQKIGKVSFDSKEYESTQVETKQLYQRYQEALRKLNMEKDRLVKTRLQLEKTEGRLKLVEQEIQGVKEKIKELEETKKRIDLERKEIQKLSSLYEVMTSFRTHLISRIRPALAAYATEFFRELTDGRYEEVELDENYNIMIYDNGKPYPINRFSGGEEDLANLCLRLAISEVITERSGGVFNLLVLDEIFGSQDMIRQQNILRALHALSSKFRQIFLITHVEELKNSMQHIIHVYEDGDVSKVEIQ